MTIFLTSATNPAAAINVNPLTILFFPSSLPSTVLTATSTCWGVGGESDVDVDVDVDATAADDVDAPPLEFILSIVSFIPTLCTTSLARSALFSIPSLGTTALAGSGTMGGGLTVFGGSGTIAIEAAGGDASTTSTSSTTKSGIDSTIVDSRSATYISRLGKGRGRGVGVRSRRGNKI